MESNQDFATHKKRTRCRSKRERCETKPNPEGKESEEKVVQ